MLKWKRASPESVCGKHWRDANNHKEKQSQHKKKNNNYKKMQRHYRGRNTSGQMTMTEMQSQMLNNYREMQDE